MVFKSIREEKNFFCQEFDKRKIHIGLKYDYDENGNYKIFDIDDKTILFEGNNTNTLNTIKNKIKCYHDKLFEDDFIMTVRDLLSRFNLSGNDFWDKIIELYEKYFKNKILSYKEKYALKIAYIVADIRRQSINL